jgi:hypothetical protein
MNRVFSPQRSSTVHVCSSIEDVLDLNESSVNHFDGKNIIICVVSSIPESFTNNNSNDESTLILGNNIFELRYISLFESKSHFHSRSKWNPECYTRHSGEYTSWWHQERGDHMATNMMAILLSIRLNVWHLKPTPSVALLCMSNVIVPSPIIGNRDFSGVRGGKTHVICQCIKMPFIPTNTQHEVKQKCIKCNRRESFVCCSSSCPACLCIK